MQQMQALGGSFGSQKGLSNVTSAAVAYGQHIRSSAPLIKKTAGGVVVSHKELISTLAGSVSFAATRLPIQPGLSTSFPWLSIQAAGYQMYRVRRMCVHYVPRVGSSTAGSVLIAPDYNPNEAAPGTEAIAGAYHDFDEGFPWSPFAVPLNPQSMHAVNPWKLVRTGPAGDRQLYDSCNVWLCTTDMADTSNVGKIFLDYEVEFKVPQRLNTSAIQSSQTERLHRSTAQTYATTVAETVDWNAFASGMNPYGLADPATGVITMPEGTFRIYFCGTMNSSGADLTSTTVRLLKNASAQFSEVMTTGVATAHLVTIGDVLTFESGDTFEVDLTAVAAAGTLTLSGARLYFSPA